jgi:uncharacterized protein (DUF1499 family)
MTRPDAFTYARAIALAAALLAVAMILASGPGTRAGWWGWEAGFGLVKWAFYLGAAAAISALALLLVAAFPRHRARLWMPLAALAAALVAVVPPLLILSQAKSVPPIHDITTDAADPPAFVALLEARRKAPNGFAYAGEAIAAQQRAAYADVKPLILKLPPREALQSAIDAARALGWEVVASDAASGRLEATDTTAWFGFKDDVVVRIRAEGEGSRVDVRSVSRVGQSDLGANARRIRKFLSRLS